MVDILHGFGLFGPLFAALSLFRPAFGRSGSLSAARSLSSPLFSDPGLLVVLRPDFGLSGPPFTVLGLFRPVFGRSGPLPDSFWLLWACSGSLPALGAFSGLVFSDPGLLVVRRYGPLPGRFWLLWACSASLGRPPAWFLASRARFSQLWASSGPRLAALGLFQTSFGCSGPVPVASGRSGPVPAHYYEIRASWSSSGLVFAFRPAFLSSEPIPACFSTDGTRTTIAYQRAR